MSNYGVVIVHTISSAMRGEKVLAKARVGVRLIPVPRQCASDCGLAIRFAWQQAEMVRTALVAAGVEIARIQPLV